MIQTPKHLAYELKVELAEIEAIVGRIDNFYYKKVEIKKDKDDKPKVKNGLVQTRTIYPSIGRLKVIQKRIQRNILDKLPMPEYAYGAVKGKDNVANAKRHQGKKYVFTTDLKSFFPSINHGQVFDMFLSFNFSPSVARLLTKLTTYKGEVPQGAPTSPTIANLVFIKTGDKLALIASTHKLTFTTFIDDLTFSAPFDFKAHTESILALIQEDGYRISHNKTNYKTKMPIITGVVVKNNCLDITKLFKLKLENMEGKTPEQKKGYQLYADKVRNSNK